MEQAQTSVEALRQKVRVWQQEKFVWLKIRDTAQRALKFYGSTPPPTVSAHSRAQIEQADTAVAKIDNWLQRASKYVDIYG